MNSHTLARILLSLPDLPVATHASNHTYDSSTQHRSHGPLKIGKLVHGNDGQAPGIVIGDISRRHLNYPNDWISEMYHGDAPEDWRR